MINMKEGDVIKVIMRILAIILGIAFLVFLIGTGLIIIPLSILLVAAIYDAIWG